MDANLIAPEVIAAGYTMRPATRADLPAMRDLLLVTAAVEENPRVPSPEDFAREFDEPWSDPATQSRLVFAPDGSLAAYLRVFANPQPTEEARAYLMDEVHPEHADALYDAALDWLVEAGTQRLREIVAETGYRGPMILRAGTPDHLADRLALYKRHGFAPIRYFFRMRRDLSQPIPDRPLPDGLRLVEFSAALSEKVRQADEEAFRDHWGHEPATPEDWEQVFVQSSTFRPDLTPIVLDGDEVAAFSLNRVDPDENARQTYTTGWINSLGTRRRWRKRGLASALLVWSMRAFKAEGLEFATLGVDAENLTGALGLYESLGFVSYKRFVAFGRPVQAADH